MVRKRLAPLQIRPANPKRKKIPLFFWNAFSVASTSFWAFASGMIDATVP